MTALASAAPQTRAASPYRLSFPHLLRSEWIKLSTLRSTWWSIGVVVVLSVGVSLLIAGALTSSAAMAEEAGGTVTIDPIMAVLSPTQFTMLLAGALGAIAITGEYSTGMIRSSLTAEPRRGAVLVSKAVVVAALLGVSSLVVFAISIVATAPILRDTPVDWSDPSASSIPVLYGALAMAVFALIGLSWGFILRNGPGAIAATVGLLFVLPIVSSMFPYGDPSWQWIHDLADHLPMFAAQALMMPGQESSMTGAGMTDAVALLTLGAWVAAGLLGSWAVLRTRDA
ncbi:ABC transporter permease subunit [Microbacterium ulmi]|uniref:ABC transporter permease subunit n=1 Tax=Microbacterium ulmi TaxID=179095 RepID=A0A7Y2PXN6_9MICO|nr:ABC transporter permease subunit [Microbacterium ulmi]NII71164.1 ABC-2 type transport system permease protein [Microbacterium ulmi]NNH02471.1 ABC transporter permease subunit [Microbacterium ulmi]